MCRQRQQCPAPCLLTSSAGQFALMVKLVKDIISGLRPRIGHSITSACGQHWATMWAIKRCHTKARGPKSVHTKASPEPTAFEATPYDPYANICKLRKHEMSKPSKLERSDGLQGRSDGLQGNTRDTDSQCFKELLISWTVSLDFPSGPAQVICGEVANQCLKVITRVGDPWGPKVSESRSTSGPGSSSPKKMRLWQYLCSLRGSEAILGVSKLEGENHSEISEAAGLCESMTIIPTFNYHGPMAVYGSLFALETLYPFISCHYSFNPFDSSMRQVTSKPVRRMLQNKVSISAFGNATRSALSEEFKTSNFADPSDFTELQTAQISTCSWASNHTVGLAGYDWIAGPWSSSFSLTSYGANCCDTCALVSFISSA